MNTAELLDAAKKKTGSDNKTAGLLEVTRAYISNIRHGKSPLSLYQAARLCELVGKRWYDALEVIADSAEKADRPEEADYWRKKAKGPAPIVALVLILGGLTYSTICETDSSATMSRTHPKTITESEPYIYYANIRQNG
jgi:transcriptional regulator with XRE-family HTH domain